MFSRLLKLWLALVLLVTWATASVAQPVPKEYQIQAVFLWRLAQFTDWPATAFEGPMSPIVIGVLGDDPFRQALDLAVKDETAHHRRIEVKRFTRVNEISSCHILFISRSEEDRAGSITKTLGRRPILTVSDIDRFHQRHGGMISFFVTEQNKVRLRINVDTVKAAGITLDSQLLRMGESSTR